MRRFYEFYPIWSTVSTELSWAHFQELIRIDRKEERDFYEKEPIKSNWGCRELRGQINTKLYDRYLISPNKQLIIEDSKKGLIEKQPEELLKTPYIFEFTGLKENKNYLETDILNEKISVSENRKISHNLKIKEDTYKVFPVYYPVGNGIFNIDKSIEDIKWIIKNIERE